MADFKVIIVGGGPAGLMAGTLLSRAGIDYVILERRTDLQLNGGSGIAVWPHNQRVLDQLGLLGGMKKIRTAMTTKYNLRRDGSQLSTNNMFETVGMNHGYEFSLVERHKLVELLYDHLPDRESHLLQGKTVASMSIATDGVTVTCDDGTSYTGSMIIAADGGNSTVRRFLYESAGLPTKNLFTTSYVAVFGTADSSALPHIERNMHYEIHGNGLTMQINSCQEHISYLLYSKLPQSTKDQLRFTDEEKAEFVKTFFDAHISHKHTFEDLWKATVWSHMSGLEEGVLKKWSGERVVLIGDAVHQMTPNAAMALNTGWQSAVVLVNLLRKLVLSSKSPDSDQLSKVFRDFEVARRKNVEATFDLSSLYIRVVTWDNMLWRTTDQYITPLLNGDVVLMRHLISPLIAEGKTIDFLEEPQLRSGTVKWKNGRQTVEHGGGGDKP